MKLQINRIALRKESWWLLGALIVIVACIWPVRSLQKTVTHQVNASEQWMQVQVLAQEALLLKARLSPAEQVLSTVNLQSLVEQSLSNKASILRAGDSAVVTLEGIPSQQLVHALNILRQEAQAQVHQVQLHLSDGLVSGRIELQLLEAQ